MKINCNKIPMKDKGCHLIAGAITAMMFTIIANPVVGVLSGVVVGVGKEMYDKFSYGKFDFEDLVATFLGGCFGAAIIEEFTIFCWR